jgi:NAD(P)-dependent dehydrogenase (short-subunit alcohol dehydrogenase family)
MSEVRLDGKVAIVTGATGGWGGGAAYGLARRGAKVILNARTQSKLDTFAVRLDGMGGTAVGIAQDVRSFDGAAALVEAAVDTFGRVDALVNCAGVTVSDPSVPVDPAAAQGPLALYGGSLLDMPEDAWLHVIAAELSSVFACTKAAATQMVAQGDGGSVTTVVGTIVGAAGQSAHAAAKGGVLNGIWSWSDELKPHGITVNGVRGYVRSLLTDPGFSIEEHDFEARREVSALPTEPSEAGELIAWLASDDARDITGAYLGFDGPRVTIWEPKLPDTAVYRDAGWSTEDLAESVGPLLRRRPTRPTMTDLVIDLFSAHDKARAARAKGD